MFYPIPDMLLFVSWMILMKDHHVINLFSKMSKILERIMESQERTLCLSRNTFHVPSTLGHTS